MSGRYFFFAALFFIFLLHGSFSHAGNFSHYTLKNSKRYSSWELERIQNFLKDAEARLPYIMKTVLDEKITVDFVDFPSDRQRGLNSILIPRCPGDQIPQTSALQSQMLGQAYLEINSIQINRLFLNEIFLGPEGSQKFNCRHGNLYQTALGVLIHETGHLFDRDVKVTSTAAFQSLMGFKSPWLFGQPASKNKMQTRSVNPYELTSLIEAFAVNLEFFLLDPEFACRRPNINHYYEQLFMVTLNPGKNCKSNYDITVKDSTTGSTTQFNLDPSRLYSVDFLLADSGSQLMSFWGHAMFNLVYCAPGVPVGPNCRDGANLSHHVVVSFRANLTDLKLSYLKGIFGGYPSQPFLLTMTSVMREYNRLEKRNLESIPLNMSRQQKINFVGQVLEMYSSYMGEFKFLTNNCATETKDVIKAVVLNDSVQELGYSTPKGLLKDLMSIGLIHPNYKKIEYSHFESYSEKYRAAYEKLLLVAEKIKLKKYDLDEFIELDAKDRKVWYSRVIDSQSDKKANLTLALQVEQDIKDLEKQSLDRGAFEIILKAIETPGDFEQRFSREAQALLKSITENIKRSERFNVNSGGYGIFLPHDNREGAFEQAIAEANQKELQQKMTFIRTEAEKMMSDLVHEIENTGKNIAWLIKSLREVMTKP